MTRAAIDRTRFNEDGRATPEYIAWLAMLVQELDPHDLQAVLREVMRMRGVSRDKLMEVLADV